jgi:hypothetical protein
VPAVFGTSTNSTSNSIEFINNGNVWLKSFTGNTLSIGEGNLITNTNTYVLGKGNQIPFSTIGQDNFLIGNNVIGNSGTRSFFALGKDIDVEEKGGFIIGTGTKDINGNIYPLQGSTQTNSLTVGFNSDIPTIYVTPSAGVGTTGKVGIGDGFGSSNNPQYKLDLNGNFHATENTYLDQNLYVQNKGYIGFNNQSPFSNAYLEVKSEDNATDNLNMFLYNHRSNAKLLRLKGGFSGNSQFLFQVEGNNASGSNLIEDNVYFKIGSNGRIGVSTISPQAIFHVQGKYMGTNTAFLVTNNVGNPIFSINHDNGTTYAKKVIVTNSMPVPDYVFDSCYSLIDLNSLSAFLKVNKHLPGIPSATDIANSNNEIDVNHFQMLLLQKSKS